MRLQLSLMRGADDDDPFAGGPGGYIPLGGGMNSFSTVEQEEPGFTFGEEIIRYNPVAAPTGAVEGGSRMDRVSFNTPA
jgi:hypothetical protein